jgi:hypothetical protein
VTGSALNLANECVEGPAELGCAAKGCEDGAITYAQAPSDDLYRFTDGCIPSGWVDVPSPTEGDDAAWGMCD